MEIITADFETYYSTEYSLTRLTYEEYIRDPRFQVIMLGLIFPDGKKEVIHGSRRTMRDYLSSIDWSKYAILCHNTLFDGAIFSWHFNIRPKLWLDTYSMARAMFGGKGNSLDALSKKFGLKAKGIEVVSAKGKRFTDFSKDEFDAYANYCLGDCEITRDLFQLMYEGWYDLPSCDNRGKFPVEELKLIDTTIRMFTEPVFRLDTSKLEIHLEKIKAMKADLLASCGVDKADLMSNPKLASVLQGMGVEVPMKLNSKGKETYAFAKTDAGFKALEEHPNPVVQAIMAARLGTKSTLEETRTQRFIDISSRGLLPIPLKYSAAKSLRWGGTDKINLQNLPSRGGKDTLKKCILAPEDHVVMDCDSAQIEARVLAYLAMQDDLVLDFKNRVDIYSKMASVIYNMDVNKDDNPNERFVGKTTILGNGYGCGGAKFKLMLKNATPSVDIELEEANRIVAVYRSTYQMIPALWTQGRKAIEAMANGREMWLGREGLVYVDGFRGLKMPNGLYMQYRNLRREKQDNDNGTSNNVWVYDGDLGKEFIHGAKLIENVCQCLARVIIGQQMLRLKKKHQPRMTVHDAIGIVVHKDEIEEAKAAMADAMSWTPPWCEGLPLSYEVGYGESYGDC